MNTYYLLSGEYHHGSSTFTGKITEVQAEKKPRNHEHCNSRGPITHGSITYSRRYYTSRIQAETELQKALDRAKNTRKYRHEHPESRNTSCKVIDIGAYLKAKQRPTTVNKPVEVGSRFGKLISMVQVLGQD